MSHFLKAVDGLSLASQVAVLQHQPEGLVSHTGLCTLHHLHVITTDSAGRFSFNMFSYSLHTLNAFQHSTSSFNAPTLISLARLLGGASSCQLMSGV